MENLKKKKKLTGWFL